MSDYHYPIYRYYLKAKEELRWQLAVINVIYADTGLK